MANSSTVECALEKDIQEPKLEKMNCTIHMIETSSIDFNFILHQTVGVFYHGAMGSFCLLNRRHEDHQARVARAYDVMEPHYRRLACVSV